MALRIFGIDMSKPNPFYKFLKQEDLLHIDVVNYALLAYNGIRILHAPLEGRRTAFERYKASMLGIEHSKGFPDLQLFYKGKAIALELKALGGKASKEQKQWILDLISCNIPASIEIGFDAAKSFIDKHFSDLKKGISGTVIADNKYVKKVLPPTSSKPTL